MRYIHGAQLWKKHLEMEITNKSTDILYDSNQGYDTKELQLYTKNQIIKFII